MAHVKALSCVEISKLWKTWKKFTQGCMVIARWFLIACGWDSCTHAYLAKPLSVVCVVPLPDCPRLAAPWGPQGWTAPALMVAPHKFGIIEWGGIAKTSHGNSPFCLSTRATIVVGPCPWTAAPGPRFIGSNGLDWGGGAQTKVKFLTAKKPWHFAPKKENSPYF